ncbi:hypothetical protein EDB92DRAFT_1815834 [Lactarius akahatsu]|uniref:Uncharacterized protein n=1 Tax=Lactarius akahatsu TaxID=416441 RepID=A0AAD4LKQ2_9AGAM|nr:hypothetical protein EDB92DRAFT_1815834 [Lactarius akahatsu]
MKRTRFDNVFGFRAKWEEGKEMKTPDDAEREDFYGMIGPHGSRLWWCFCDDGYVRVRSGKRRKNWISKKDVRVQLASARQLAINLRPQGLWRPGEIRPGQGLGLGMIIWRTLLAGGDRFTGDSMDLEGGIGDNGIGSHIDQEANKGGLWYSTGTRWNRMAVKQYENLSQYSYGAVCVLYAWRCTVYEGEGRVKDQGCGPCGRPKDAVAAFPTESHLGKFHEESRS